MKISRIVSLICFLIIIFFQWSGYEFSLPFFNYSIWTYLVIHLMIEFFHLVKSKLYRIIFIAFMVLICSSVIGLLVFAKAFGTETWQLNEWEFDNYEISQRRHLGWAGPHYETYHLYKLQINGILIKHLDSTSPIKEDTCTIKFQRANFNFNRCDEKLLKIAL